VKKSKERPMIYLAAGIALLLLVYLFVAMIRPEKF
jgi:K+-transporting ATPase KdpF subunit